MKVYEYGCRPPIQNAAKVDEQMLLAHRYRNKLTEIELDRRTKRRDLEATLVDPSLIAVAQETEDRLTALRDVLKQQRKKERGGKAMASQREEIAVARLAAANTRLLLKQARKQAREALGPAIKTINDAAYQRIRDERAKCGVFWGTYLVVEAAAKQAALELRDPKFHRWTGDGCIAVQIQYGIPTAEAYGTDTRVRLQTQPWIGERPHRKRDGQYVEAWVRVGSEGRSPVWAVFPTYMHRPLPADARIKWVKVLRRRVGPQYRWKLQMVVDEPSVVPQGDGPAVGIDIGWRLLGNGEVRVAVAVGEEEDELRLPARLVGAFEKLDDLKSIRSKNFDGARDQLSQWLREATDIATARPVVFEQASTLAQWRSPSRLAALVHRWRDNRFPGDDAIFAAMETWRYRDYHLWEYEAHMREQVLRQRLDLYRCWAKGIACRYRVAVLERFDLRSMARRPAVENKEDEAVQKVRWLRHVSALSVLRSCIEQAAANAGGTVIVAPAEYTTQDCCEHSIRDAFDAATELVHQWPCGCVRDQDVNAARNLLAYASGAGIAESTEALAPA